MAIVSAEKFVQAARDNGYAVGGFNTNNLEWTQAILRAAEAKQAPVLIQTSMGAAKYMGGLMVHTFQLKKTLKKQLKLLNLHTLTVYQLKLKLVQSVVKKMVSSVMVNWHQSKMLKLWLQLVSTSLQQVSVTSTVLTQKTGADFTLTTCKN